MTCLLALVRNNPSLTQDHSNSKPQWFIQFLMDNIKSCFFLFLVCLGSRFTRICVTMGKKILLHLQFHADLKWFLGVIFITLKSKKCDFSTVITNQSWNGGAIYVVQVLKYLLISNWACWRAIVLQFGFNSPAWKCLILKTLISWIRCVY